MGRCLVFLQLDMPCFDDSHGNPVLSWIGTEEEGIGQRKQGGELGLGEEGGGDYGLDVK